MRALLPALACGLGLLVSTAALADGVQQSAQATPATFSTGPESKDGQRIFCRHLTHQGMLLPQYACGTQQQWDAARHDMQATLNDIQMRGLMSH